MSDPTYVQEYNAILEVLNTYNEGAARADTAIMKRAFDEQSTIFSVDGDGKRIGGSMQWAYDIIDADFPTSPDARCAIVRIDIVGNAASARIDSDNLAGSRFTDFLNLVKIEGKWIIMNKVFHTH